MNDDWKNPHWDEEWKTERNKQIYRWTGKEPWYGWKCWLSMCLIPPNKWIVILLVIFGTVWIHYT